MQNEIFLTLVGSTVGLLLFICLRQSKVITFLRKGAEQQKITNDNLVKVITELRRTTYLLGSSGQNNEEGTTKLYVGNLDYSVSEDELADIFVEHGDIQEINIPVERYSGKKRGFGFVTFATKQGALSAVALNGSQVKGRDIQVNFAKER